MSGLRSASVRFLLELLEQEEPVLCGAAAAQYSSETRDLIDCNLLMDTGYECVSASEGDHDDMPVSLAWSEQAGGLAYFDPTSGPVLVPNERLILRRVRMEGLLAAMTPHLDLPRNNAPFSVVMGVAWEIGEARIGKRSSRSSIWFARRLFDPSVQNQMREASAARPHSRHRILLTSTGREHLDSFSIAGASIVSMVDVLERPASLAVSPEILSARLGGHPPPKSADPIVLSSDGTELVILGEVEIHLRPGSHGAIAIRKLVDARARGKRLRMADLTHLGTGARLFGRKTWTKLKPYLSSQNGLWGFDI